MKKEFLVIRDDTYDGMKTQLFQSEEDAKKNISADVEAVVKDLTDRGCEPRIFYNADGTTKVVVPATCVKFCWRIAAAVEEEPRIVRLCETVYDLALEAQYLLDHGRIEAESSRELFSSIFRWAKEFEAIYPDNGDEGDYMELIEGFAQKNLLRRYG